MFIHRTRGMKSLVGHEHETKRQAPLVWLVMKTPFKRSLVIERFAHGYVRFKGRGSGVLHVVSLMGIKLGTIYLTEHDIIRTTNRE